MLSVAEWAFNTPSNNAQTNRPLLIQGGGDNTDGGIAVGSHRTAKGQEPNDERQQQQDEQEEEEKAMAAGELSPIHSTQPLDDLGESSTFSSPLEHEETCWGEQTAMETVEDSCETPMPEEVAAGLPGPLSLLRVPPCKPSLAISTCCDAANDCDDDPETRSDRLMEQNGSLASPSLVAPPSSLDTEGGGQIPQRGIAEGITVDPVAETLPEDCDRRDSSIECLVPVEEGTPTASFPTEEGVEVEIKTGGQQGYECRESQESKDGGRGNDELELADHVYAGSGGNMGRCSVLYISSSSSEAGDSIPPQTSVPTASTTSGMCREEGVATVVSLRPEGDTTEPDPSSQAGEEVAVDMKEPCLEKITEGMACEGARTSEPLECSETTVLAHSSGGGFTGGVGEVNCDVEPDGVLSDNSCIDSDDGTAATIESIKEVAREDERPSLPLPLSPEPTSSSVAATDGFGGGGGESLDLPRTVMEPRVPQFSPSLQIEPDPSRDRAGISKGDGGVTWQEWHDGMSPLTSPAVGERPNGDDHGGFDCSEATATVLSSRAVTSDATSEDAQQVSAFKFDGGEEMSSVVDCYRTIGHGL